ncbi:MAG: radical SAM protein [Methylococcus sp.]
MAVSAVDDQFSMYGRWNSLLATGHDGGVLGIIPAHDGDFFPESILDYVEAIRIAFSDGNTDLDRPFKPLRVDIDITQACNARCTFCFSRPYQVEDYRGQWISTPILSSLITELGTLGTRTVRFCGGGDPLIHPEIDRVLPLAHRAGLYLCVITNLDFIEERISDSILEHVDHLRWSVNAATDATRIAIHRPRGKANLLSETIARVVRLMDKREKFHVGERRPMVWATYLVLPENVDEIIPAAKALRATGIDSLSFRPVFHGLGGCWSVDKLARLSERLHEVAEFDDRPRFCIFTPKRFILDAAGLNPSEHFDLCISRRLRTVLEATSEGVSLQSCGTYRGSGPHPSLIISEGEKFDVIWQRTRLQAIPVIAPNGCNRCIDVSMNVTLSYIAKILKRDPNARFERVLLPHIQED